MSLAACKKADVETGSDKPTIMIDDCGYTGFHLGDHDSCEPMDAVVVTAGKDRNCACSLGYAWNGTECVHLGGCGCRGHDCDKLTPRSEQCAKLHAHCQAKRRQ